MATHRSAENREGESMIVISRKEGESIAIGNEIVVTVIEVQEDNVRVSIERLPDGSDDLAEITDVVLEEEQVRKRPR
jgi:carbon storage regulator CsrA